ncbi:TPA: gluconate 5-dehydrogenase, partial [Yersinia enterocolitica]
PRDGFTASLRSACFHHCGHFVINLKGSHRLPFFIF